MSEGEAYELQVGDHVRFTRIIHGKRGVGHRTDYATGKPIVVPAIPEQVLPQSGEGELLSINVTIKKLDGEKYRTGRVSCAKPLGIVTAVLDDAVLVAKPLAMDLGIEAVDPSTSGPSIYSSDAKGIA